MQSVGIEPTLLRTRALSVRLNRSAKTAIHRLWSKTIHLGYRGRSDFMAQWQRVGFQTRRLGVRFPLRSFSIFFLIFGLFFVVVVVVWVEVGGETRVSEWLATIYGQFIVADCS